MYREALYYNTTGVGIDVKCVLCPHGCTIGGGKTGICGVRKNEGGKLYSMNYGKITSLSLDPIEKKPLYHFHPGSMILSAGTFGCNFKCPFCQNWSIAHEKPESTVISAAALAQKAEEMVPLGNIGLACTYNEPSIWFEFVLDCFREVKRKGLLNVLVTNGFISREPLYELLPLTDALNIDLKAFNPVFYKEICKGAIGPVMDTIRISHEAGLHVEVTTLLITGQNDSEEEIDGLAQWLSSVSPHIPLHLSRFFPNYRMTDRKPTPADTMVRAKQAALRHLEYVHLGNI